MSYLLPQSLFMPISSSFAPSVDYASTNLENHLWGLQSMLREIIDYIESVEFDAKLAIHNDAGILKQVLEETSQVKELTLLCHDRAVAVFLLGHIISLATRDFDRHYRNVYESAVVAYLHCLTSGRTDLNKAAIAAASMLKGSSLPSRYIAKHLQ